MNRRCFHVIQFILSGIFIFSISCESPKLQPPVIIGHPGEYVPNISLKNPSTATDFNFTKNVNYLVGLLKMDMASCRTLIPVLDELNKDYPSSAIKIVGVCFYKKHHNQLPMFLAVHPPGADMVSTPMKTRVSWGGIRIWPTTILVDKNLKIIKRIEGFRSSTFFRSLIQENFNLSPRSVRESGGSS